MIVNSIQYTLFYKLQDFTDDYTLQSSTKQVSKSAEQTQHDKNVDTLWSLDVTTKE